MYHPPFSGGAQLRAVSVSQREDVLNRARAYLVAAIAGAVAYSSQAAIYSSFILPRLPEWQSVSLYWWAVEFSPVVVLLVAIALLASGPRSVVAWVSAAFIPWQVLWALYAAILDRPIGHDLWVPDPSYWVFVALLYGLTIGFCLACFAVISVARRLLSSGVRFMHEPGLPPAARWLTRHWS